jgi:hypothetical protein
MCIVNLNLILKDLTGLKTGFNEIILNQVFKIEVD